MSEPVAHHPDPDSAVRFPVSVLVCAHNEEENLPGLLHSVLTADGPSFEVGELIVVASGCTDRTVEILRVAARGDARVRLVLQDQVEGKASAIAMALAAARFEIVIVENADTVPDPEAFERLVAPFVDNTVGIVCSHPIPANVGPQFTLRLGRMLWTVHDRISRRSPKAGEAFALRRTGVDVPKDVEDDDTFLGAIVGKQGRSSRYAADAIIWNRVPESLAELVRQRARINRQVVGLRRRRGIVSPSWNPAPALLAAWGVAWETPRDVPALVALVALEGIARTWGALAGLSPAGGPVRTWVPIPSTKIPIQAPSGPVVHTATPPHSE